MGYYYLEIIKGNPVGFRYALPEGVSSIGRSSSNSIKLPSTEKSVSGHHALVYHTPERIFIQDMQSTNGTFVNEQQITEETLKPGDTIGFGKEGPRLKVILTQEELDLSKLNPEMNNTPGLSNVKTINDDVKRAMYTSDSTSQEDQNAITKIKLQNKGQSLYSNVSVTTEMEKKILEKDLNSNDLKQILNDSKRVEKILQQGNIGATQTNMLRSMYDVKKSMRNTWIYVICCIGVVSLGAISFFAIRTYQYKSVLDKAGKIKEDLEKYEKQIAKVNANPDANKAELEKLISNLEDKQKAFEDLKPQIEKDDFGKIYSDPVEQKIDQILQRFGETDYHIPEEMVQRVKYHLSIYSGNLKDVVSRYIKRRELYFPMVQKVFREKNIPVELAYICMLESGFNPKALSHAGARGLWQFMPETGKRYGLIVTEELDERIIPEKATYAAAEYFKDLIGIFGGKSSVMLCMAAYNAGEGRIIGALRKIDDPMRNRDFWYIYRMGYLAEETNEYIPRVIALMIISENPGAYNFDKSLPIANPVQLESERDFIEYDYKVQ